MKFDLISDFHVEMNILNMKTRFWKEGDPIVYAWDKDRKSDILVIAGDISNQAELSADILLEAAHYYDTVVFTDGNHDMYGCTTWIEDSTMKDGGYWEDVSTIAKEEAKLAAFADEFENVVYLNGHNTFLKDGCLFIGANGWYNFEIPSSVLYRQRVRGWIENTKDPLRLNWGRGKRSDKPDEPQRYARKHATLLQKHVEAAQDNPEVKEIVVVTHVPPTDKIQIKPSDPKWGYLAKANGAYYNGYMRDVIKADGKGKIKVWAFGHTHHPFDFVDRGVRYLCNPRGYRSELRNKGGFKGILEADTVYPESAFGVKE